MKTEQAYKEKKSHTIQPMQNNRKIAKSVDSELKTFATRPSPLMQLVNSLRAQTQKPTSLMSTLHKYVYSAIVQKKGTSEINADDYNFFKDYLVKKAAYYIWQQKGALPNQDKEEQDKDYHTALSIVEKELQGEIKQAAYYQWEKAGKPNDPTKTDKFYYEALHKVIADKCLSTTEPAEHPETKGFILKMEDIGCPTQLASEIWQIILNGIEEQKTQNTKAVYKDPQDNGKLIYTSDLDRIRNQNKFYVQLGEKISQYLSIEADKITNSKKLALWTGGYDLSNFAESQGCKTLETTQFGKVLDSFYLSNNWNLIGPLWNIISETFVKTFIDDPYADKEVHVFIRAYDPASVLIRQEIDQIYSNPKIPVYWHCIGTPDKSTYQEIDENGDLTNTQNPVMREDVCLLRLMKYYEKQEQQKTAGSESLKGGEVMRSKFENVLTLDFLGVKGSIALYRYHKKIQELAYYNWEQAGQPKNNDKEYYYAAQKKVEQYIDTKSMSMGKEIKEQAYLIWEAKPNHSTQSKQDELSDWNIAKLIVVCNNDEFLKIANTP